MDRVDPVEELVRPAQEVLSTCFPELPPSHPVVGWEPFASPRCPPGEAIKKDPGQVIRAAFNEAGALRVDGVLDPEPLASRLKLLASTDQAEAPPELVLHLRGPGEGNVTGCCAGPQA